MKTLRQLIADYIVSNPDCCMVEIRDNIGLRVDQNKVCKKLKNMVDAREIERSGTLKNYTYCAGVNIDKLIDDAAVKSRPNRPSMKGRRITRGFVLKIRQTWVRAGDYEIEKLNPTYRSLWDYANSFTQLEG